MLTRQTTTLTTMTMLTGPTATSPITKSEHYQRRHFSNSKIANEDIPKHRTSLTQTWHDQGKHYKRWPLPRMITTYDNFTMRIITTVTFSTVTLPTLLPTVTSQKQLQPNDTTRMAITNHITITWKHTDNDIIAANSNRLGTKILIATNTMMLKTTTNAQQWW